MFKVLIKTLNAYLRTKLGKYVKPVRYQQIYTEISRIKPKNIMEIGTWNGMRARKMIEEASRFTPVEEIYYYGYDLFESLTKKDYEYEVSKKPPHKNKVLSNLESTRANIKLFAGYTQETMKDLESLSKMDFVFIDGGHAEETVRNDWYAVERVMHSGTVVIFDDYWHNRKDGPRVVIDGIDQKKYNVTFLPEMDVFFNPDFGKLVISLVKVTQ